MAEVKPTDIMPGFRFGSYTVVSGGPADIQGHQRVWIQCVCGSRSLRKAYDLRRRFPEMCAGCRLAARAAMSKQKKRTPQQVAFNRLKRGDYASPEEMAALVRVIQHRPESSTSP